MEQKIAQEIVSVEACNMEELVWKMQEQTCLWNDRGYKLTTFSYQGFTAILVFTSEA